jgi:MoaA/NifB/PqqE/SkfB family radical SAM enzyme
MNELVVNRVGIVSKSPCQLRCGFCAISTVYENDLLTLEDFKKIILALASHGIKQVELTPLVGDGLLHKEFTEMALFARDNNVQLEVHTNLLNYHKVRKQLIQYDFNNCLSIAVSIYGYTKKEYLKVTKRDLFARFKSNLMMLVEDAGSFITSVTLTSRIELPENSKLHQQLKFISLAKKEITYETSSFSGNWGGLLADPEYNQPYEKKGVCGALRYFTGIWPDGDVSYCGCFDLHKNNTVGNIFINGVEAIYGNPGPIHDLMMQHSQGIYTGLCADCNYFYR